MSIRHAGITAGAGLLLMIPLAVFGYFVAVDGLVTPGNAAQTAADITASEGLFRSGIASLIGVVALDVVVAWALYRVFRPVHAGIALLAAWFRMGYSVVYLVAIGQLAGVLRLLGGDGDLAAIGTDRSSAMALLQYHAFDDIWSAGYVLFGLHLVLIGYLAYRSAELPRLLGVLVALSGVGYLHDRGAEAVGLSPWIELSMVAFVGEALLALWLVARSHRLAPHEPAQHADPAAAAR